MRQFLKFCRLMALPLLSLGVCQQASAGTYNQPVPENAYITYGGLHWAWAGGANGDMFATIYGVKDRSVDLSYQGQFGWRRATIAELLRAPKATDFLFAGANVPLGGRDPLSNSFFTSEAHTLSSDGACAAAYFSSGWSNACDWFGGQDPAHFRSVWAGLPGEGIWSQVLVVRSSLSPVPVPAALPLFLGALGGLGVLARKRKQHTAPV